MTRSSSNSRVLNVILIAAVAVVVGGLIAGWRFGGGRPTVNEKALLAFSDFEYASTLSRAEVVSLLGPPTSCDPGRPGVADRCLWEAEYRRVYGVDRYKLTLWFSKSEKRVLSGGLERNGKGVRR